MRVVVWQSSSPTTLPVPLSLQFQLPWRLHVRVKKKTCLGIDVVNEQTAELHPWPTTPNPSFWCFSKKSRLRVITIQEEFLLLSKENKNKKKSKLLWKNDNVVSSVADVDPWQAFLLSRIFFFFRECSNQPPSKQILIYPAAIASFAWNKDYPVRTRLQIDWL